MMKPSGKSEIERWYTLARTHIAIIVQRARTRERCKHCLRMRTYPNGKRMPWRGCNGCCEMETFMQDCRAFFNERGKEVR